MKGSDKPFKFLLRPRKNEYQKKGEFVHNELQLTFK